MQYKYVPDSYHLERLRRQNISDETFLNMQLKYRSGFEAVLKKYLNFKQLDITLNTIGFQIPCIQDMDYNFYHKFSTLESKYLFLRNNIHVENLSADEISYMSNQEYLSEDFVTRTFPKVLFEEGDFTFYGIPHDFNLANSKAVILEFAYNEKICNIEQSIKIREIIEQLKNEIKRVLEECLKVPVCFIVNCGFEDIYHSITEEQYKLI